jgi:hypothetical protein
MLIIPNAQMRILQQEIMYNLALLLEQNPNISHCEQLERTWKIANKIEIYILESCEDDGVVENVYAHTEDFLKNNKELLEIESLELKKVGYYLCDSVIDGKKLAIELGVMTPYKWLIADNSHQYTNDAFRGGIVLVNNLNAMNDYYNNVEWDGERYTKENIDAVCKMLETMFEFCQKRQIKYINLNF